MFRTFSKVEKLANGSIQTCHCLVTICEYRNNQRELGFQHRLQQCFIYLFIYLFHPYLSGAPIENIVQNHLNIALLNVF